MEKVCFCTPLELGSFGDSTHITEVWKRMPELLNARVYIILKSADKRLSNIKDLNIVKPPTLFIGKRIKFISRILSHVFVVFYCLFLSNLALVYERQTMLNISGLLISKIKGIPLIYEVNTLLEYEKGKTCLNIIITKIAKITEKLTVAHADKILVTTQDLKKIFHRRYEIPFKKIEVVPNGANTDLFYPMDEAKCREELGLSQNIPIVCFVGGLGKGHGAKNLVNCAPSVIKQIPNTKFLIVGEGPKRTELEQKAASLDVKENFIFAGKVPYEEVPKYMNSSDVCVILNKSELKKELGGGSAIKLYEYMACGKPVIGTVAQTSFNILKKYDACVLVDVDNIDEIVEAVVMLLENKELREELGKNGRNLVEKKYNWDVNAKKVARICEGEIKNGNRI